MTKTLRAIARFGLIVLLAAGFFPLGRGQAQPAQEPPRPGSEVAALLPPAARARRDLGQLPLYFVENRGQLNQQVAYYVQGSDKAVYFTPQGVTLALSGAAEALAGGEQASPLRAANRRELAEARIQSARQRQRWAVKLDFLGANPHARLEGLERGEATLSFFRGSPEQWRAGVPTYARIIYRDLWPGIDLLYSGAANRLKYEFVVHPGADPGQIRLRYRGADAVSVDQEGRLQVTTPLGGYADEAPLAYQEDEAGQRQEVAVGYAQPQKQGGAYHYGFQVGDYDRSKTLVLDPALLLYCGYIGGADDDVGYGIAVDAAGNAYLTGYTLSTQASFPETVGPDLTFGGDSDAFVAKVNAAGTALVYAGYIGGSGDDVAYGIAVDGAGNAYVTGYAYSGEATFPVIGGPDLTHNGDADAFVVKVNAAGTALLYSGYIGGYAWDGGYGIAVDGTGHAYITGETESDENSFPETVGPSLSYSGGFYGDGFVAKVSPSGAALLYSGYIGGVDSDYGQGIAVDGAGNATIAGWTESDQDTFPVRVGPDLTYNGGEYDAFVAKVNATGTALVYAGYIGGSLFDDAYSVAVDGAGNAYVTGYTTSTQATFPVTVGPDVTHNGQYDAYVAKVNAAGTAFVYCGYIGGTDNDYGQGIAVDGAGNAYIAGDTKSSEATFPLPNGPDITYNGGQDAFVAKVNAAGAALVYAGYIGGLGQDGAIGVAVDGAGNAYVTGSTDSSPDTFPETVGPGLTHSAFLDVFVAKVGPFGPTALDIPLRLGWNLFSFNVQPLSGTTPITQVVEVLSSIEGFYSAVQGYDQGAQSYYPDLPPEFNDLRELTPYHGYWIKMTQAATLRLVGDAVGANTPLSLDVGWNLVSYLPPQPISVAAALASIAGKYTAVQGFHDGGAVSYYTDLPPEFNDLQCLRPQHGYWIKTTEAVTLTYPTTGSCATTP